MSRIKFPEPPAFLKPHLSSYTDETRSGSEYCPYCGGHHSTDAEIRACADRHSYVDSTYRCPRCGAIHSSLGAANDCCADEKRFERDYDSPTYSSYMSGGTYSEPEPSWYERVRDSGRSDPNDGGGIFQSLFDFGGSEQKPSQSNSDSGGGMFQSFFDFGSDHNSSRSNSDSGGMFSSFFDFGGNKTDDNSNNGGGGGFFGW